jgi:DnaJ-domain-containing protein 1
MPTDSALLHRPCAFPGCPASGDYRAPQTRQLQHYYWFCLTHVRAYNAAWNYYADMNEAQIEAHIREDFCWQRATWPLGQARAGEAAMQAAAQQAYQATAGADGAAAAGAARERAGYARPEQQDVVPPVAAVAAALAVLELRPPQDFQAVKTHYKQLVKRYHPDANGGNLAAEARLKEITEAFATLKVLYGSARS